MGSHPESKIKALVIDDDIDIGNLLTGFLETNEFEVMHVTSLVQAIFVLGTFEPAVVLLDYHLPDGLGLNFIKHIKNIYSKTKIILITANHLVKRENAISEGAFDLIYKPFKLSSVNNVITRAFNNSK